MLKGTYIFYNEGVEIYRSENVITKFGKRFLANFIAGNSDFNSKEMAFGIATSNDYPISDSNSRLGFEFYRSPVEFGSINIQPDGSGGFTYSVIYKSSVPTNIAGQINEVGLYPGLKGSINIYSDKFISDFEDNIVWIDSSGNNPQIISSENGVVPKIGSYLTKISTPTSSSSKEYFANMNSFDLSGYSTNDSLSIAFNQYDTNLSNIKIRFYSSDSDYFESTISPTNSTGYKILSTTLNNALLNPIGSPTASAINKISIVVASKSSGASTIYIDGLRINDEDAFNPDYGIISRSIITDGLIKTLGRNVDVEYRLELF